MMKKKFIFLYLAIGLIILASLVFAAKYVYDKYSPVSSAVTTLGAQQKDWWNKLDTQMYTEAPDLKKAEEMAKFKPKIPKETLGGTIIKIIVEKSPNDTDKKMVFLIYGGFQINEEPDWLPPGKPYPTHQDLLNTIEKDKKERNAGVRYSSEPFVLVNINGIEGLGSEPGYQKIPFNESRNEELPGFVAWHEKDAKYEIYALNNKIKLSQLIKVAESMYQ